MSNENLPQKVDPYRFADNAVHLQGDLPISQMVRLNSSLRSHSGKASITVAFGVDEQKIRFMRGRYTAQLILTCQRCMQPLKVTVTGEFLVGLVPSDEAAAELPKQYDPVLVKEGESLELQTIIEDEILISLPIVPMHRANECPVTVPYTIDIAGDSAAGSNNENPFKVIEQLRSKKRE